MTTPVAVPEAPLFPLTREQVLDGLRVLRYQVDTATANPFMDYETLTATVRDFVASQSGDSLGAAAGLFGVLTFKVCTPEVAARLPEGAYGDPGSGEAWNMSAVSLLPRVVVLAGEEAVMAALTDTLDPAALPDASLTVCAHVAAMAELAAGQWVKATHRKRRDQETALTNILDSFIQFSDDRWPGFDTDASWRTNLGHEPFVGSEFSDKEMTKFGSVSSLLRITDRYPSSLKGGESALAGSLTGRGATVRVARSVWVGVVQVLVEDLLGNLSSDMRGFPDGEATALKVPTHRVAESPVRDITLELTAGLRFGAFSKSPGVLPVVGEPFPKTEDLVVVDVVRNPVEDVKVSVALPSRSLPSAEDAAVGVMRVLADALLTAVPDLTPPARAAVMSWRDNGPRTYIDGSKRSLTRTVDVMVASMERQGIKWVEQPPAAVLTHGE